MENLSASRPAPGPDPATGKPMTSFGAPLYLSQTNTWASFQALASWAQPFNNYDSSVANATPGDGIRYAYETYGSTYFELYVADVDYPAYRSEFENWSTILSPPAPRMLAGTFTPDGKSFQLPWSTISNVAYQVECSANLRTWSNASPLTTATGTASLWLDATGNPGSDPATNGRRWYRVREW